MSPNQYKPHILVLPEDDANRQIANGFIQSPNLNARAIQVLPPAGGWQRTVEQFINDYVPTMRKFPQRMMVLLIDFDNRENRLSYAQSQIPDNLKERVFILGVQSEPENLKRDINKSFEEIGDVLAQDCSDNTNELWGHELLKHNKTQLERMIVSVKPFLFN